MICGQTLTSVSPQKEPVRFGAPRGYNTGMPAAGPKPEPEPSPHKHHAVPEIYTLETTGLLVVAILILILTLVRYWHHIPWGAR